MQVVPEHEGVNADTYVPLSVEGVVCKNLPALVEERVSNARNLKRHIFTRLVSYFRLFF